MKGSKGLELPINVIVIVAIAVLVLVVAAALFSSQIFKGGEQIKIDDAFFKGCQTWRTVYNCVAGKSSEITTEYVKPANTNRETLSSLCAMKGYTTEAGAGGTKDQCAIACGC